MKQPDRKADHSPSPIVEVQGADSYASTHLAVFMALIDHRDNFTFHFV